MVTTAARGKPFPIPFAKVTGTQGKAISTQRTSSPDMSTLHTQTYIRNDIICLKPPVVAAKATKPSLNLGKKGRRVSGMWYLSSKPSPPLERQPGNEVSVGAVANRPQKLFYQPALFMCTLKLSPYLLHTIVVVTNWYVCYPCNDSLFTSYRPNMSKYK